MPSVTMVSVNVHNNVDDLMQKFLDEEMKNMTVLNERVSLSSALSSEKEAELDFMADAIADSVKSASET